MDKTKDGRSTSSEEDNVAVSKTETVQKARNDDLKKLKEKFAKGRRRVCCFKHSSKVQLQGRGIRSTETQQRFVTLVVLG